GGAPSDGGGSPPSRPPTTRRYLRIFDSLSEPVISVPTYDDGAAGSASALGASVPIFGCWYCARASAARNVRSETISASRIRIEACSAVARSRITNSSSWRKIRRPCRSRKFICRSITRNAVRWARERDVLRAPFGRSAFDGAGPAMALRGSGLGSRFIGAPSWSRARRGGDRRATERHPPLHRSRAAYGHRHRSEPNRHRRRRVSCLRRKASADRAVPGEVRGGPRA